MALDAAKTILSISSAPIACNNLSVIPCCRSEPSVLRQSPYYSRSNGLPRARSDRHLRDAQAAERGHFPGRLLPLSGYNRVPSPPREYAIQCWPPAAVQALHTAGRVRPALPASSVAHVFSVSCSFMPDHDNPSSHNAVFEVDLLFSDADFVISFSSSFRLETENKIWLPFSSLFNIKYAAAFC